MKPAASESAIEFLRRCDTCSVANAVESFGTRLRNEGFMNGSIRRAFPNIAPVAGYAVPVKIHCSSPPMSARAYPDRTNWWNYILTFPQPRIVVIEDADPRPGAGALVGEVHANILRALGCIGVITNGVVRDIQALQRMGFHVFSSGCVVSHAYAHIIEIGHPVTVGGLKVAPGDLLHGDACGVLSVPQDLAEKLPAAVARNSAREHEIISLCRSESFSLDKLCAAVNSKPCPDGLPG